MTVLCETGIHESAGLIVGDQSDAQSAGRQEFSEAEHGGGLSCAEKAADHQVAGFGHGSRVVYGRCVASEFVAKTECIGGCLAWLHLFRTYVHGKSLPTKSFSLLPIIIFERAAGSPCYALSTRNEGSEKVGIKLNLSPPAPLFLEEALKSFTIEPGWLSGASEAVDEIVGEGGSGIQTDGGTQQLSSLFPVAEVHEVCAGAVK